MWIKEVVPEKEKTNFLVPRELLFAFREIAQDYGPKRHWTLFSAAILLLLETPRDVVDAYAAEVGAADFGHGSIGELIERAKSKRERLAVGTVRATFRDAAHSTEDRGLGKRKRSGPQVPRDPDKDNK